MEAKATQTSDILPSCKTIIWSTWGRKAMPWVTRTRVWWEECIERIFSIYWQYTDINYTTTWTLAMWIHSCYGHIFYKQWLVITGRFLVRRRTNILLSEETSKRTSERRANEWTKEHTNEQTTDRTKEPTSERTNERTNEQRNERASKETNDRTNQRTNERAKKQTKEQTNERTNQRTNEQENEQTNEKKNE